MTALPEALRRRLVIVIGIGLVAASLGNGAMFYLKKVGAIDRASYQAHWSAHCDGKSGPDPWTITSLCPCAEQSVDSERPREQRFLEETKAGYLYRSAGYEIALKLAKDILAAGFVLLSLNLIWQGRAGFAPLASCWPLAALSTMVLFGIALSLVNHGWAFTLAGLRPYLFLAIALTGAWVTEDLRFFARCMALLLGMELLLVPIEFTYGLHIHGHFGDSSLAHRLSGTLVAPNSFGLFAATSIAFIYSFSDRRKGLAPMLAVAVVLAAASGSATALLALFLCLIALSVAKLENAHPATVSLGAIAACVLFLYALPTLVGREEVFESVLGPGARLDEVISVLRSATGFELLAGNGLGVGTNTEVNLFGNRSPALPALARAGILPGSESTVVALIKQSGLAGLFAFYSLLAWAAWRDGRARLFYLVIAVSSLTAKVTELFPVNFLLGLALAHSVRGSPPVPDAAAGGNCPQEHRV